MYRSSFPELSQLLLITTLVVLVNSCVDGDLLAPDEEAPQITDFNPKSGPPGSNVIIQGENFNGSPGMDSVYLNGYGAEVISSSGGQLEVEVPYDATTGPILVIDLESGKQGISTDDFEVLVNDSTARISMISPDAGVVGSLFDIYGINFGDDASKVTVRLGIKVALLREFSDTLISAIVPAGATTSPVNIIKGEANISGPLFTVLDVNPVLDSIKPDHGTVGTEVWIFGQYFSVVPDQNAVSFNGVEAEVMEAYNDSLRTEVPVGATTGMLSLSVNGNTSSGKLFTVDSIAPVIKGIDPTSGKTGIPVKIFGENFSPTPSENIVSFNDAVALVTSASPSELVATVPEDATTGPVKVIVHGVEAVGPQFTVESSVPQITSLSPASGQVGSVVKINGTNFSTTPESNTVTFNGTSAVVSSASTTDLVVNVPEGATSGPVLVTVSGLVSNGVNFIVEISPPQISSINPTSGAFNTQVTISGENFSDIISENRVFFNNMEAVISSATTTTLIATVPLGAGTGVVSVTTNGNTALGPNFSYLKTVFVNTHAGNGSAGFVNGSGAIAQFNQPTRMAVDSKGQIILADYSNHSIRIISEGGQVSTIAGNGSSGFVNGTGADARFNQPSGVAVDNGGNIYVADFGNNVIRKISSSNIVSTYAGTGQPGFSDGGIQTASFNGPSGISMDSQGNLYVADTKNHAIRKIDTGGNVTTIAGNGTSGSSDGKGTSARFNRPGGVCIDQTNNVYVADAYNHTVRKIDPGNNVSTIAGSVGIIGSTDGNISVAKFNYPSDIDIDEQGSLYVADYFNHKIRIIRTNNNVETLAGSGIAGFTDGSSPTAQFNYPIGIAVQNSELIYVGDVLNHRVRVIRYE